MYPMALRIGTFRCGIDAPFANLPVIRSKVEDRCEVRKLMPHPGKGALPLPCGIKTDILEAMPTVANLPLPDGHCLDGSIRAPVDIYKGGETAALARLKVRAGFDGNEIQDNEGSF
jgi:hypothetical protein